MVVVECTVHSANKDKQESMMAVQIWRRSGFNQSTSLYLPKARNVLGKRNRVFAAGGP